MCSVVPYFKDFFLNVLAVRKINSASEKITPVVRLMSWEISQLFTNWIREQNAIRNRDFFF